MKLQVVGCSHHSAPMEVRERLAFSDEQARDALLQFRRRFPESEAVLLSTCNRVELYTASEAIGSCPTHHELIDFLAEFHGVEAAEIFDDLFERTNEDAVRHLFSVAASLDSMVVGEAQILSQVKQAYELATAGDSAGPLMHLAFQHAIHVAKRVANETAIHQKRVSIPSVAIKDFAAGVFEHFDDKKVLVIGAGEMAEEALRYLIDEGARDITIVNRTLARAEDLGARLRGRAAPWERRFELLAASDLVISATGASEPIVRLDDYRKVQEQRRQEIQVILDLAAPRDFEPSIGEHAINLYLYSIDDLKGVCERNRRDREREWPKAERIIEDETARFMAGWRHRATGPTIARLRGRLEDVKDDELARLLNKLEGLDEKSRQEIARAFDRLVNKLLHPPLETLRDEAEKGAPHGLLEALKRLFQIQD
jgi:glutamyl-tRNA reductase